MNPQDPSELPALLQAGRHPEVEALCRRLLERDPGAGPVWQLLAFALARQGRDALPALTEAVRWLPGEPSVHLNLGNALARLGRFEAAAASFERALALEPAFAAAHQHLGETLARLGRLDAAAASLGRAIALQDPYPEAHHTLGMVLLKLARVEEAIASFARAAAQDPAFADAHAGLAAAQRRIGRLQDAIDAHRRVLQLEPGRVEAHTELATTLRLAGRAAEAEAACSHALALQPDNAAAVAVRAELLADAGRFAEAQSLFRRALQSDAGCLDAVTGLARVQRMSAADASWLTAARRLERGGLAPEAEMQLRYALGKYFDDLGDCDTAFGEYRRANELAKRLGPPHRRELVAAMIDALIGAHDAAWFRHERRAADTGRPVFIVGMLRSGTSLAEQILAAHPQVHGAGELSFWTSQLAPALAGTAPHGAAAQTDSPLRPGDADLAARAGAYLAQLQRIAPQAARVVDKMPTNFLALGWIHAAFPRAKIVHLQRDPWDTCLSIYFQHFEAANTYANDLGDLAHYYQEYRRLMAHWRALLPPSCLLELPYEGLVGDLAAWTARLLDFLELPWDERCLAFHRVERRVLTASRWQVRQPINAAGVGRAARYAAHLGPLHGLREAAAAPADGQVPPQ